MLQCTHCAGVPASRLSVAGFRARAKGNIPKLGLSVLPHCAANCRWNQVKEKAPLCCCSRHITRRAQFGHSASHSKNESASPQVWRGSRKTEMTGDHLRGKPKSGIKVSALCRPRSIALIVLQARVVVLLLLFEGTRMHQFEPSICAIYTSSSHPHVPFTSV